MSEAAIACAGLSVTRGNQRVLRDLSLAMPAGQWTAIVGPNGCGKSTLLKTLAGLLTPTQGTVTLLGRPLTGWPARERARRLSWLSQSPAITDLTVEEVVALGRFTHGGWLAQHGPEDFGAIRRAMEVTATQGWARRRVSMLSGGEQQRVHLARALAAESSVLLLDEPTTHLDPPHQEDIARLLRAEARKRGVCVLSAIHDLSVALIADRIVVMGYGRLIGHGTIREALAGDWLSAAFATRIEVIEHQGAHLWRPALEELRHD
jgi:iron complex transport system ATP-binding protein